MAGFRKGSLPPPCHSERSEESVSLVGIRILQPVPGLRMTEAVIPALSKRSGSNPPFSLKSSSAGNGCSCGVASSRPRKRALRHALRWTRSVPQRPCLRQGAASGGGSILQNSISAVNIFQLRRFRQNLSQFPLRSARRPAPRRGVFRDCRKCKKVPHGRSATVRAVLFSPTLFSFKALSFYEIRRLLSRFPPPESIASFDKFPHRKPPGQSPGVPLSFVNHECKCAW